jgi:hypothetical protein
MSLNASLTAGEALVRLAVARGAGHLMDDTVSQVYLDALEDVDIDALRKSCRELGIEARGQYETALPSVGVIRERAEEIVRREAHDAQKRLLGALPKEAKDPTFFCLACFDEPNAWRIYYCFGDGQSRTGEVPAHITSRGMALAACGRHGDNHIPHAYAEKCACSDVNPVIAQHRERAVRYVAKKAGGRS